MLNNALALNISKSCNNNCSFCFCRHRDLSEQNLNPEVIDNFGEIKKILLKNKNQISQVIFSGNEPTLNLELISIVSEAKKFGYRIELKTNGRRLANFEYCRQLLIAGVDHIVISVQARDGKIHDSLTGQLGSFRETLKGIKNIIKLRATEKISLATVVTQKNYHDLPSMVAFFGRLGIREIQFNAVYFDRADILPKFSEIMPFVICAISNGKENGISVKVYGFPLCFLGKYWRLAQELTLSNRLMKGCRIENYLLVRKKFGRKKAEKCRNCFLTFLCEGAWKPYFKLYGTEEFKPIVSPRGLSKI